MKKIALLAVLAIMILSMVSILWADSVSIGTGTDVNANYPFNAQYDYSYSQQLYKASLVGMSGTITKLRLYYGGTGSLLNANNWTIYLGNTTKYSFDSTTDWVPLSELTQVFSGVVTLPGSAGWVDFNFSTPFNYDNSKHLVIAVDENTIDWPFGPAATWGIYDTGESSRYCYIMRGTMDNSNPDPANPGTAISRSWKQNRIQLEITPHTYQLTVNTNTVGSIATGGSAAIGQTTPWISSVVTGSSTLIGSYSMNPKAGGTWDPSSIEVSSSDFAMEKNDKALLTKTISFTWIADPVYTITLTSDPSGALIFKDGVELGMEPQVINPAMAGTYTAVLADYAFDPYIIDGPFTNNLVHEFTGTFLYNIPAFVPTIVEGVTIESGINLNYSIPSPAQNDIVLALQNFDDLNSSVVTVLSGSGIGTFTISVSEAGTWYALVYFNGSWQQSSPYSINVVPPANGIFSFDNIDFDAKGDVIILLGEGEDPTLPVTLSMFNAIITAQNYVSLYWRSESETEHLGYNLLRSPSVYLTQALPINTEIITQGMENGTQTTYAFIDREVMPNSIYYYWLEMVSLNGNTEYAGPLTVQTSDGNGDTPTPEIPTQVSLGAAYPNPFNPTVTLPYQLSKASLVTIEIFNIKGQRVSKKVLNHSVPGHYKLFWDATDEDGHPLPTGIYYYRMNADNYQMIKKMTLKK